jgi:nucleotide-binding universal stress UspA family protein
MRRSMILCPVDTSAGARAAIAQAATLARFRHAELHLLYVTPGRGGGHLHADGDEEAHPMIADAIQSAVDAVRGRGQHVRYRIEARRGNAEGVIGAYGRRHRAGLIVVSAAYGGRRGVAHGPLPRRLGRSAPCPVLVWPATRSRAHKTVRASFRQVVCGVDFTKVSVSALEAAAAFAPHRGGRMTLVHTVGDVSRGMVFAGSPLRLVPRAALKGYRVRLVVGSGRPYRLILDVASEVEADLIVLGLPRRSRLDEWLSGSTSRAVLGRAKPAVLLVPA